MKSLLMQHRESLGVPLAVVARAAGMDRSTLYRLEAGKVQPSRANARALFDYYAGQVPLAHIYDPEYALREATRRPAEA
jgi:DNA-binding XRE family transcriptional regulator